MTACWTDLNNLPGTFCSWTPTFFFFFCLQIVFIASFFRHVVTLMGTRLDFHTPLCWIISPPASWERAWHVVAITAELNVQGSSFDVSAPISQHKQDATCFPSSRFAKMWLLLLKDGFRTNTHFYLQVCFSHIAGPDWETEDALTKVNPTDDFKKVFPQP